MTRSDLVWCLQKMEELRKLRSAAATDATRAQLSLEYEGYAKVVEPYAMGQLILNG